MGLSRLGVVAVLAVVSARAAHADPLAPPPAPEGKSVAVALALPIATTAAGYALLFGTKTESAQTAGVVLAMAGPNLGGFYVRRPSVIGIGGQLTGCALLGAGVITVVLSLGTFHEPPPVVETLLYGGAGVFVAGSIYAIVDGGVQAARSTDERRLVVAPTAVVTAQARLAPGVALSAQF